MLFFACSWFFVALALASKEKSSGSHEKSSRSHEKSSEDEDRKVHDAAVDLELRKIPLLLDIHVNGKRWEIEGVTEFKPESGESITTLEFDRTVFPKGFQPELLTYILFGKLTPSKPFGKDMLSLFDRFQSLIQVEKPVFNISRSILLMEHFGKLDSYFFCDHSTTDGKELIKYVIWGDVNVPFELEHVLWPMVELWEPSEKMCFWEGGMHWSWKVKGHDSVEWLWGYSETDYTFNCTARKAALKAVEMKEKVMRVFTFEIEPNDKGLVLHETIKMYDYDEYIKTFIY